MELSIVEHFEEWAMSNGKELEQSGLNLSFTRGRPTPNSGAYIEIESETIIARITLWESLELDLDAVNAMTGEQIIWEHHHPNNLNDALKVASTFIARLNDVGRCENDQG